MVILLVDLSMGIIPAPARPTPPHAIGLALHGATAAVL
jgi:hypothetical protein